MIVETGIEKIDIEKYVEAMAESFYRKRFYFGEIKTVLAQNSVGENLYDLVYVEIIDNQVIGNSSPEYAISLNNMQSRLENIETAPSTLIKVDEKLRPKFMSTIQEGSGSPLGFIKYVPICYTTPGNSSKIISRLNSISFNFNEFDFDTDRIIIENPKEPNENGWLYYPTGRINNSQ